MTTVRSLMHLYNNLAETHLVGGAMSICLPIGHIVNFNHQMMVTYVCIN